MSAIIKPLANTIDIGTTANSMGSAIVVKVVNPTAYDTLKFQFANGVQYASVPLAKDETVLVQKAATDLLVGSGMNAVAIAWPKG